MYIISMEKCICSKTITFIGNILLNRKKFPKDAEDFTLGKIACDKNVTLLKVNSYQVNPENI